MPNGTAGRLSRRPPIAQDGALYLFQILFAVRLRQPVEQLGKFIGNGLAQYLLVGPPEPGAKRFAPGTLLDFIVCAPAFGRGFSPSLLIALVRHLFTAQWRAISCTPPTSFNAYSRNILYMT